VADDTGGGERRRPRRAGRRLRARILTDPRLSNTVLEAFLARRTALLASAADTLQIVGSLYSPASMALRE
jgi:hypothetical protein